MSLWQRIRSAFVGTKNITTQQAGDVVTVKRPWTNVLMGCCDCGLMHRYDFRVSPQGHLLISARRDTRMTAAIRRDKSFAFISR